MQVADLTNDEVKSHLQVINLLPFSFPFLLIFFFWVVVVEFFCLTIIATLKKKTNFAEISAPCPEDG